MKTNTSKILMIGVLGALFIAQANASLNLDAIFNAMDNWNADTR